MTTFFVTMLGIGLLIALGLLALSWLLSTPQQRGTFWSDALVATAYGTANPEIVCPHCQVKGQVFLKDDTVKTGISGAKATGALLTSGLSLPITGLSQKKQVAQARCMNCQTTWMF